MREVTIRIMMKSEASDDFVRQVLARDITMARAEFRIAAVDVQIVNNECVCGADMDENGVCVDGLIVQGVHERKQYP